MRTGEEIQAALTAIGARGYRIESPYRVIVDAQSFALATDGHVLLAVHSSVCPDAVAEAPAIVAKLARDVYPRDTPTDGIVEAAQLAAFVGARTGPRPPCATCNSKGEIECDDCGGAGETDCECHCGHSHEAESEACDGDGTVECPSCTPLKKMPGSLCGHVVNRALLRDVLEAVGVYDGRLSIRATPKGSGFIYVLAPVDSAKWFAVVMSMQETTRAEAEFEKPETWQKVAATA